MKQIKILKMAAIFLLLLACVFVFIIVRMIDDDSWQIEQEGAEFKGSIFHKYKGKIYAEVVGAGDREIKGADADSFHEFKDDQYKSHVGVDKNAVYCANERTTLDPKALYYIGNNYYGDGKKSIFCSMFARRDDKLSSFNLVLDYILYSFGIGDEPILYKNIVREISDTSIKPLLDLNLATNGKNVYYEGEILKDASPSKFRRIKDESGWRNSAFYMADGEHVYFKDKLLAIKDDPSLYQIADFNDVYYLFDPKSGSVYANDFEFDPKFRPFSLINQGREHTYHSLFRGKGGIYYYDDQSGQLYRAGDDPFSGSQKQITKNVFIDGKNLFYLESSEIRANSRSGGLTLKKRLTFIKRLPIDDGITKLGDADLEGSVWKSGDKIYYFDDLGTGQLVKNTIYEVTSPPDVQILLHQTNIQTLRDLIGQGRLVPVNGEQILQAQSVYDVGEIPIYVIFFAAFFIIMIGTMRKEPFGFARFKKYEK
ncbi:MULTISPECIES: DKNYY domain-containing protein [Campylobacter]|uniref:DKNYY domain-containing protein n=1 Tax=Campylobacter TaxID=194 RepID=UPI00027A38EE|nr:MULTISPECIES: DKNYY domain-containing protein [Campylobacter]EJP75559.1 DKNYY family protein [Campylobacter sp. FOBRC14]